MIIVHVPYIVIGGTNGGVYFIKNAKQALPTIFQMHQGTELRIRNIGNLRVTKIEAKSTIKESVDYRYIYIYAQRIWNI